MLFCQKVMANKICLCTPGSIKKQTKKDVTLKRKGLVKLWSDTFSLHLTYLHIKLPYTDTYITWGNLFSKNHCMNQNPIVRCLNFPLFLFLIQEKNRLAKCCRLTIFFRLDTEVIPQSFTQQVCYLCMAAL